MSSSTSPQLHPQLQDILLTAKLRIRMEATKRGETPKQVLMNLVRSVGVASQMVPDSGLLVTATALGLAVLGASFDDPDPSPPAAPTTATEMVDSRGRRWYLSTVGEAPLHSHIVSCDGLGEPDLNLGSCIHRVVRKTGSSVFVECVEHKTGYEVDVLDEKCWVHIPPKAA